MPIQNDSNFPDLGTTYLTKYFKFQYFEDLIKSRSLYFTKTSEFDDPLEGTWGRDIYLLTKEQLKNEALNSSTLNETSAASFAEELYNLVRSGLRNRGLMAACCFSEHANEQYLLWHTYGELDDGICIKTDYSRLADAFFSSNEKILPTKIEYVDLSKINLPMNNLYWPFKFKDLAYSSEREVRFLTDLGYLNSFSSQSIARTEEKGVRIELAIENLFSEVILAPKSTECRELQIRNLLADANVSTKVTRSEIFKPIDISNA